MIENDVPLKFSAFALSLLLYSSSLLHLINILDWVKFYGTKFASIH